MGSWNQPLMGARGTACCSAGDSWQHAMLKDASHKRLHVVGLLLFGMSEIAKSIKTESRLVVTRGFEEGGIWSGC